MRCSSILQHSPFAGVPPEGGSGSENRNLVGVEGAVPGHEDGIEPGCLRNEHPVERITVVQR